MAKKITRPKQSKAAPPEVQRQAEENKPPELTVEGVNTTELVSLLNSQIGESKGFWNGKDFKLDKNAKENRDYYYGRQVSNRDDGENQDLSLDNRIFSAIRTVVPFVTKRITEPEAYPSSRSAAANKFAEDIAKALFSKAKKEKLRQKVKYAVEDAIIARRGYLKPRYDAATGNWCCIEYVPAESIIVDHVARPYEEPRYFRHLLQKSPDDLISMFPAKKQAILTLFGLTAGSSMADYQKLYEISEDWKFMTLDGQLDLVVCWSYKEEGFGVIKDPNWRYDGMNFLPQHMMPLIPFNVLSDGRRWIDPSSYVEQAKYAQNTINLRGEQISENAGLGSVGMPVVDSLAIAEEDTSYLQYEKDTVLQLEVPEGKRLQDVFDKWQASPLTPEVYKDKLDAIEAVNNTFGASALTQGGQSDNETLGQDLIARDQSQGRQADIVEAIDNAMARLYPFMAQFLLVYGSEKELFKIVGENSAFDYIILDTEELDVNAELGIQEGSSLPIDNAQIRATADKSASNKMIDPLTYWEALDKPNAERNAKRLMDFTANPQAFLADVADEVFDRDAFTDIQIVKAGGTPPYREELEKTYFDYLNKFALSGAIAPENPNLPMEVKQAIVAFINTQLARGTQMLGLAETQLPTTQDVAAHNQEVDSANESAATAAKAMPPGAGGGTMNPSPPAPGGASVT